MDDYYQLKNEVQEVGLQHNTRINQLLEIYQETEIAERRKAVKRKIRSICAQQRQNPFQKVPLKTYSHTESIKIGKDWKTGTPYLLPQNQLVKHTLISAATGAGKTTLLQHLLPQLNSVPYWIFDLKKDYRHMKQKKSVDDLTVIPGDQLRLNPLKPPPGVTWQQWKNRIVQVFADTQHLLDASSNHIMQNVSMIYRETLEKYSQPPKLKELADRIEEEKVHSASKKGRYQETVLNRLKTFTEPPVDKIFDVRDGIDLENLLHQNTVFELDELPVPVQNFLMEYLLEWIYQYRVKHPQYRGNGLNHLIVADEAKQLFDRNKETGATNQIPHISLLVSKIRTFGVGIIASDQEATKLIQSLIANSNTKIILFNADHNQLNLMSQAMGLNQLQQSHVEDLGPGELVLTRENHGPFRIQFPDNKAPEQVTDEEVEDDLSNTQFSPKTRERSSRTENVELDAEQFENPEIQLSDPTDKLLRDIVENPFASAGDRYKEFSSTGKGVQAKNELVEKDLVKEKTVHDQNRNLKLFELTSLGREHLENQGKSVERKGRGGIKHRYWQHRISHLLQEQGFETGIEKLDADIYAKKKGTEIAVEIAMGKNQHEITNIRNDLENEFDQVKTLALNEDVESYIENKINESSINKVSASIQTIQRFTEQLKNEKSQ